MNLWKIRGEPRDIKHSVYSLISTAKANQLEPYGYLRRLFDQIPSAKTVADFERLLPFRHNGDSS